jgi:uncharacterized protein YcbX
VRSCQLIDVEGTGWLEDEWAGSTLSIGAVVLVPLQPCIRCTMVTRAQPGLEADAGVFRTLARHHRGLFGVWCHVLTGGTLSAGKKRSSELVAPSRRAHTVSDRATRSTDLPMAGLSRSCRVEIRRATALRG